MTAERQGFSSLRTIRSPVRAVAFQSMRRTSSPGWYSRGITSSVARPEAPEVAAARAHRRSAEDDGIQRHDRRVDEDLVASARP